MQTISDVISHCVTETGISHTGIVYNLSTKRSSTDTGNLFSSVSVLSDNFFDESDDPDSLRDVLEYILTPFTCQIKQLSGKIYVSDLNALAGSTGVDIDWRGADSALSTDRVYSEAEVTLSAYEETDILRAELEEDDFELPETDGVSVQLGTSGDDLGARGFDIYLSATKGVDSDLIISNSNAQYFGIKPTYSGSEYRGVAWTVKPTTTQYLNEVTNCRGTTHLGELFRARKQPYIGKVNSVQSLHYNLCVKLDFLFDVRYNPFEQSAVSNEKGNYERMQNWCNFGYVPIMITLKDASGNALYHYENKTVVDGSSYKFQGDWVAGAASWGDAYLAYYDTANRKSATGFGGWSTNKPCIGYYRNDLPSWISKRGDGEYIKMPPAAGWLDIRVGTGVYQFDYGREVKDIYSLTRWVLYRSISIEVVDGDGLDINPKDQVTTAWLDKNADDRFEIECHVGTKKKASPIAKGALFDSTSKTIIDTFYRAGQTAELDRLMVGTIYSQHAARKNKLTGTCKIASASVLNEESKKYLVTADSQDLRAARSSITMIELSSDDYTGIEYQ